ncbi:MAG TPA: glycosyltransferase family 4 protein, partial [Actinomycetota bacterium]|nr:glycosyltransferase family 4 protein [Actinomycetota bacterium]
CVGPLRHQKGQDLLLTAWPLVRREIPDATLVLVGAGSERGRLESLAGPGVVFAGHREDVVTWLAAAAVVTIPSRWDGLSLSLLEAMSCARSVVATDTPGAGRVLNGGGEVVPIGDTGALAGALTTRLRDPSLAAAEGDRGRARVEQDFDWRRVIEQMNAAYGRVISGQP